MAIRTDGAAAVASECVAPAGPRVAVQRRRIGVYRRVAGLLSPRRFSSGHREYGCENDCSRPGA
jgi:hypothetical protein